ncbi:MAG TPA: outer membrane lipoprotein chaperone LolA [Gemmatimonadaceae bacterium]|nr:outer membrane lipoprotein chaperone LolA [Gemmatimonadaceae bacterium]
MITQLVGILLCGVVIAPGATRRAQRQTSDLEAQTSRPVRQPNPADAALAKAVAAYADVKTARATFEQTIVNPLVGSTLNSRGEFEQRRPNKFAFRFTDPKGDRIISDGKFVWVYLPSSQPDQVIRIALADGGAGSLDLISEFFDSPRARYTIKDGGAATIDGKGARAVLLTPSRKDASFVKATVWIDTSNGKLLQFEAEEPSGITRKVRITSFTPNVDVSASAFVFKRPKGVRVVDRDAIGG